MVQSDNRQQGVLRSLDWWTIGIYLALLTFGWISVCGASYTYGDNDIFSLGSRSGMQIIWIGTSIRSEEHTSELFPSHHARFHNLVAR